RENRLIVGDGEELRELRGRDIVAGAELDSQAGERLAAAVVERIKRDRRLIVEQDDERVADMDERDLLVRDRAQIEPLCPVELDDLRLVALRLGDLDDLRACGARPG